MTVLQQQEKLLTITEDLMAQAKAKEVTAAEVNAHYAQGFDVQVRLGNVERLAFHQDRGLVISVYFGYTVVCQFAMRMIAWPAIKTCAALR
jgi:PmbA protein